MAHALTQFQNGAAHAILNTWLQFSLEFNPQSPSDTVNKVRGAWLDDVRDVVRVALEVDDYLVVIYREMPENTDTTKAREVFANPLQMAENLRDSMAVVVGPFADM